MKKVILFFALGFMALGCKKATETPTVKIPQFVVIDKIHLIDFDTLNLQGKAWDNIEVGTNRLPDVAFEIETEYTQTSNSRKVLTISEAQSNVSPSTIKAFVPTTKIKIPYKDDLVVFCSFVDYDSYPTKDFICGNSTFIFKTLPTINENTQISASSISVKNTSKVYFSYEY
jgi:hypothetical protein